LKRKAITIIILATVLIISLLAFTGTFPKVGNVENIKVGAIDYFWWGIPFNNHWNDVKSNYTPVLDNYSSSEPQIANQHISWAKDNGIDFFSVPWLGTSDYYDHRYIDNNLKNGLLKANLTGFEFCLFYETDIILNATQEMFNTEPANYSTPTDYFQDVFINDIIYAASTYFNHSYYFRINEKPVFIIYNLPSLFKNLTSQTANKLLSSVREQLNQNIYLVGDLWLDKNSVQCIENDHNLKNLDWSLFDAVTSYLYSNPQDGWDALLENATENYPKLIEYMNAKGLSYFPNAYPAFKDATAPADNMTLNVNSTMFAKMLETAVNSLKNTDDNNKVVMITSWNEWMEATAIEPSRELGNLLLETVGNVLAPKPPVLEIIVILFGSAVLVATVGAIINFKKKQKVS